MQNAHLSALEAKHAVLDRRIAAESQRPCPTAITLATLKKQKLRVKEEMRAHLTRDAGRVARPRSRPLSRIGSAQIERYRDQTAASWRAVADRLARQHRIDLAIERDADPARRGPGDLPGTQPIPRTSTSTAVPRSMPAGNSAISPPGERLRTRTCATSARPADAEAARSATGCRAHRCAAAAVIAGRPRVKGSCENWSIVLARNANSR